MRKLGVILRTSLASLCLALATACPRNPSQAAPSESAPKKDYQQMLERARSRKEADRSLGLIRDKLEQFQKDLGRLPTNLVELARLRYVAELPRPPPGLTYAYDPVHGNVQYTAVPRPREARAQGTSETAGPPAEAQSAPPAAGMLETQPAPPVDGRPDPPGPE